MEKRAGATWPCQRAEQQGVVSFYASSVLESKNAATQAAVSACCGLRSSKALPMPLTGIGHLHLPWVKQSCFTCGPRKPFILPVHNAGFKAKSFLLLTK